MPSFNPIVGCQPRFFASVISRSFLGVPSGISLLSTNEPSNLITSAISIARSIILMSSPVPMFMYHNYF